MDSRPIALYVNLDHRTDRRTQIEGELAKVSGQFCEIRRIRAVRTPENGAIGCAASHALALAEFLLRSESKWAVIFEDDFQFSVSEDRLDSVFRLIRDRSDQFDAVQLAFNNPLASRTGLEGFIRVFRSHTASAYYLSRDFGYKLLPVFLEAHRQLEKNKHLKPIAVVNSLFAIDVMWNPLQATSRFFAVNPPIGIQRPSYSDILQKQVNYGV